MGKQDRGIYLTPAAIADLAKGSSSNGKTSDASQPAHNGTATVHEVRVTDEEAERLRKEGRDAEKADRKAKKAAKKLAKLEDEVRKRRDAHDTALTMRENVLRGRRQEDVTDEMGGVAPRIRQSVDEAPVGAYPEAAKPESKKRGFLARVFRRG